MNILQAIILGVVQGATEFLPVSSSGHLALLSQFLGVSESSNVFFFTLLHVATLLAVVVFFWRDILKLRLREVVILALATLPAVVVGLFLEGSIATLFASTALVSLALLATGAINLFADRMLRQQVAAESSEPVTVLPKLKQSILIGCAQAVAIIPGISRSGSTVAAALGQGVPKTQAFRFSFLLSIPAILGALMLEMMQYVKSGTSLSVSGVQVLGMVAAFAAGLASLRLFAYVLRETKLRYFAYYCFALGMIGLAVSFL